MHEVAIIGGGPSGSTVANILSAAGHDVVLFEREAFPRFHIGESLLPYNMRIFRRLGVESALAERFIEKWGIEFRSSDGTLSRLFHFDEALDPIYPMCFQVLRSEFDRVLLDAAAAHGAHVHQGATVVGAQRRPDGSWRLTVETGGARREVAARFVVDSSGRDAFMAGRLSLREMDPGLKKAAIFAHYRGVPRREGRDAGNIVIIMMRDAWFWMIPFLNGVTSVGVVTDGARVREQGLPPQAALERAIERCPEARRIMAQTERVSPVYAASDWTYGCRDVAGDGYLLAGDASSFVDPVFSSGVLLAMSSGEMAADLLHEALPAGDLSPGRFAGYEMKVKRHVAAYYRMVSLFYTPAFPSVCFFPGKHLGITGSVINLLAGNMEPSWPIRWRLELFYMIANLYRRFGDGKKIPLHRVFEEEIESTAGGTVPMSATAR